jgi:predicted transcriptional regulator
MLTQNAPRSNQGRGSKVRLTVDVSPELNETLDQLAENAHLTKSEILRRAIALIKVAAQAHEKGQKLALIDKDQQGMTEIIGI